MSTSLCKRQLPSSFLDNDDIEDTVTKKLKTVSDDIASLECQSLTHNGFIWKGLKYIQEKNLLLTIGTEGCIAIWDVSNNFEHLRTIEAFPGLTIYAVEYIQEYNAIICSSTDFAPLRAFDLDSGEKIFELCEDETFFNFQSLVRIEGTKFLVGGGFDRLLMFFDLETRSLVHSIDMGNAIGMIKHLKSKDLLVVNIWGGVIKIVDLTLMKVVCTKQAHNDGYIMSCELIEAKNMVVSCGDDAKINLWRFNSEKQLVLMKRINVPKTFSHPLRNLYKIHTHYMFFIHKSSLLVIDVLSGRTKCVPDFYDGSNEAMLYVNDMHGSDTLLIADHNQGIFCFQNFAEYLINSNTV